MSPPMFSPPATNIWKKKLRNEEVVKFDNWVNDNNKKKPLNNWGQKKPFTGKMFSFSDE